MRTRATHPIATTDAEINRAIARAEHSQLRRAIAATYDSAEDAIAIRFADGVRMSVPRKLVQGLQHATPEQLARMEFEGPGTGLAWPELQIAHYIPDLVAGVFGTRQWLAEIGRRGGVRRTKAKAAASRANGAKGGRPKR